VLSPIVIADGLRGSDVKPVRVDGKHFETVDVAAAIHDADSLVVSTHVTGHGLTGFAGTIKNLGMGGGGRRMMLAEITAAVLANKKGRAAFFSFLVNVTPSCDCWNYSAEASVPDIGFMASKDPVAIDQAASDMVMRHLAEESQVREPSPQTKSTFLAGAGTASVRQLTHAEELGLGSRQYELVRVGD